MKDLSIYDLSSLNENLFSNLSEKEYWKRCNMLFAICKELHINFMKAFPHSFENDFCLDDEWRIESIALKYDYEIVDEIILSTSSKYIFKLREQRKNK